MNKLLKRITCDPSILSGKPCIKGTRIPVHIVLGLMAAGEDSNNIKIAYPNLTDEDIEDCITYASNLANKEAGLQI